MGLISSKERKLLNEIYQCSPLLYVCVVIWKEWFEFFLQKKKSEKKKDFVLKRTVNLNGIYFPASMFMMNDALGISDALKEFKQNSKEKV